MQIESHTVDELYNASEPELYSLLGVYGAGISADPSKVLSEGRRGAFWGEPPALMGGEGGRDTFRHEKFQEWAKAFLAQWATELRKAICEDKKLRQQFENSAYAAVGMMVSWVVTSITTNVPSLAGATGLLLVLAVIVVKSGIAAFCQKLSTIGDINS